MESPINHHCNLAFPIYQYSFPQLITMETCREYRKSFPQSNNTNVFAWHTGYNAHKTTDVFNQVMNTTLASCSEMSQAYFKALPEGKYKYVVENLWLAMYEKSDYTKIHTHFPAPFAACYYVEVEDDCSPITFGAAGTEHVSIQPENGMLLVWLGLLPHQVAPTNKKRTCICMNINMNCNVPRSTNSVPIFY